MDKNNSIPEKLQEKGLIDELLQLIENSKKQAAIQINSTLTLLYW